MYAVIASGGKQEKVAEGQLVRVELLDGEEGSEIGRASCRERVSLTV